MPDPFSTASGMPESGSGVPDIPSQNGARPNGSRASGRRPSGQRSSAGNANIYNRRTGTANDRSDTPPANVLDFLDRLSERLLAKNDTAWPAVFQLSFLVLLPSASVIGIVMVAHAVGVPGWAIATGTVSSAGGAGAMTVMRRRSAGRAEANGGRGGRRGRRSSQRRGSHRRR